MADTTDAVEMATDADIDPKAFRTALRAAKLPWHLHGARWIVTIGSAEHRDMQAVLAKERRRTGPAVGSS